VKVTQKRWPSTRDAYAVRKICNGLVFGPIDKNNGEFSMVCPHLYEQALLNIYCEETGYNEVFIKKMTPYQVKKLGKEKCHEYVLQDKKPPQRQIGDFHDVMKTWKSFYKSNGLDRFGKFQTNKDFNVPYILFKAKNITEMERRIETWKKVRPIAPGTKHPMNILLGKVGKAWHFVCDKQYTEGFDKPAVHEIPKYMDEAFGKLDNPNGVVTEIFDIEGCFPNMPQEGILLAMNSIVSHFKKDNRKGVWVPFGSRAKCSWDKPKRGYGTWIPWDTMLLITEFSLKNTFLRMPDGRILKQGNGIPMGNPLSPGITIGTCSWMEKEWLQIVPVTYKDNFKAARYMDDILLIRKAQDSWDKELFEKECYWPPLKLEAAQQDTFLETKFMIDDKGLKYWLKNDNEEMMKVWRYHHFYSDINATQRQRTLIAVLRKVHKMCSGGKMLYWSAVAKLKEFIRLKYPLKVCKMACAILARETGSIVWMSVRRFLFQLYN